MSKSRMGGERRLRGGEDGLVALVLHGVTPPYLPVAVPTVTGVLLHEASALENNDLEVLLVPEEVVVDGSRLLGELGVSVPRRSHGTCGRRRRCGRATAWCRRP